MITIHRNQALRVLLTLTALAVIPTNNNGMLVSARVTKSSKSAKGSGPKTIEGFCTVPTVTADVYEVTGSGDPTPGSEVNEAFVAALIDCGAPDYGSDFADCLETSQANGVLFNYPLFPRNNDGTAAESQFVTSATDAEGAGGPPPGSLNDSYFKGDVDGAASLAKNKVDIQWIDYSLNDLFNVPIADIEYIQYDFYPKNCGTMNDPTCIAQFYLNVYTHRAITGAGDWYDCKYDFVPADVDFKVGEWNTFKITSNTLSSRTQAKATGTKLPEPFTQGGACPNGEGGLTAQGVDLYNAVKLADGAATLPDSPAQFLLGARDATPNGSGTTPQPLIFAFNMGDAGVSNIDEGLVGYFDNIRVQIKDQPLIIMDL